MSLPEDLVELRANSLGEITGHALQIIPENNHRIDVAIPYLHIPYDAYLGILPPQLGLRPYDGF